MISDALRTDIECWAGRRTELGLFRLAASGQLTRAMVTRYIANVTHMTRHTPLHLKRAFERSKQQQNAALASYFERKLGEEVGHDAWGDADLESLVQSTVSVDVSLTPSIRSLPALLERTIDEDAASYLTYIAFAEYVTVLVGPELLRDIEERCGVPRSSMTVVGNHIELDRAHAEEGFAVIDDLVTDPRRLRPLRQTLARILEVFDAFFEEVTKLTESGAESDAFLARSVSAA